VELNFQSSIHLPVVFFKHRSKFTFTFTVYNAPTEDKDHVIKDSFYEELPLRLTGEWRYTSFFSWYEVKEFIGFRDM
jgi:hypothetical protein